MMWGVDGGPENPTTPSWEGLARDLGGSFAARVRGLISPEVTLLSAAGEPFGRIVPGGDGRTRVEAGGLAAWIEPSANGGHTMTTAGAETLTARPSSGPVTDLELRSGDRDYRASVSPARNRAAARPSGGGESAGVSGGLTNRRYAATFDPEDPASLPVAVFLLERTVALRAGAFRAG